MSGLLVLIGLGIALWILGAISDAIGSASKAVTNSPAYKNFTNSVAAKGLPSGTEIQLKLDQFIESEVRLQSRYRSYAAENFTVAFMREILPEGNQYKPRLGEYHRNWISRCSLPDSIASIERNAKAKIEDRLNVLSSEQQERDAKKRLNEEHQGKVEAQNILNRNTGKLERFLELAYRKVATPDEYGDENPEALKEEIYKCILKLSESEPALASTVSQIERKKGKLTPTFLGRLFDPIGKSLEDLLSEEFSRYYKNRKDKNANAPDLDGMTGQDFELFVADLLKSQGVSSVSTTPATGDQGGDLLFTHNSKKYVVQAKHYKSTVGNKAVQEAHAAKGFYGCDEALVITSSTYTKAATALARQLGVKLVDGSQLDDLMNQI